MLTKDASSFAFVGITGTWGVVLFGDKVRLAEDDQPEARGLGGAEQVTKRTLFQDIFGKIALADVTPSRPVVPASTTAPWKGKEVEKIFDTPSYLLPPLGTLFDPILDEFLSPRPPEDATGDQDDAEAPPEDEMDADGSQAPIIVGNRLERIVDGAEMASMVELFKAHGVHGTSYIQWHLAGADLLCVILFASSAPSANATPAPRPLVNGHTAATAKVNGAASPAPATPKSVPSKRRQVNGVHPPVPSEPPSPLVADSPAKAGQKRKKTVG